ncbi:MAG: hypothetical protein SFX73_13950 [Kofleriaceae bacterium]|nr:hypothetical protein [Kofleriaceae bacterium]
MRVGEQSLAIDPAAATCNGLRFGMHAGADRSEVPLDEVVALAKRCTTGEVAVVSVGYTAGANATLDRTRFTVTLAPAGPQMSFQVPTYIVDPAAKTCALPAGLQM